jgi:hypothetical protein
MRAALHLLRRADLAVLLATLALVLGTWAFIAVLDAVREGETQTLIRRSRSAPPGCPRSAAT